MENKFKKAIGEVANNSRNEVNSKIPKQHKEVKKQMSIMLTPTDKEEVRYIADNANMSVSELIAYWIDEERKSRG